MTVEETKNELGDRWPAFFEWMTGQTHGIKDGEPDYYEYDVMRFKRGSSAVFHG